MPDGLKQQVIKNLSKFELFLIKSETNAIVYGTINSLQFAYIFSNKRFNRS